jgi:hypothetical protein
MASGGDHGAFRRTSNVPNGYFIDMVYSGVNL